MSKTVPKNLVCESSFTVFPNDSNYMPPMIFGGKLLSEMDILAAACCRRALYSSETAEDVVTVNVKNVTFFHGAIIKDIIFLRAKIMKFGTKSIHVIVNGLVEKGTNHQGFTVGQKIKLCEGLFIFCASTKIGANGEVKPIAHNLCLEDEL